MRHHLGRSFLTTTWLLIPIAVLLVACSDGEEDPVGLPPATLPEDLCAVLEPVVPPDLGLGDPVATRDEPTSTRATAGCTLTGPRGARLQAGLTSYALADADDQAEVRTALGAACDQLLGRDDLVAQDEGEFGCDATLPDGSFSSVDQLQVQQGLLRLELTLPDRTPEQVAAYGTAIASELHTLE